MNVYDQNAHALHTLSETTEYAAAPAPKRTSRRGFASMDRSRQREIASAGGRAAHERGTAHTFTSEEARDAGRKGGVSISRDREHMAAIGRKGGEARGASAKRTADQPAPPPQQQP
ncbi:KGG domain-containing protein [Tahibacter soli]|uniref:KGG domain-containing protein n=1 Tax=Tahibacter soli TaxID=2983605 RepID=A0A9X3YPP1_9GAMM|nr:KGG domain-containing protein [Tahibacter soli]MDC8014603.1 KGG domain-containing protein [Tahibacter soli]